MTQIKLTENPRVRRLLQPAIVFALLSIVAVTQAQTCDLGKPLTRPDSRYTDNSNGTVTDHVSGLMWKQCAEGKTTTKKTCDTGFADRDFWSNKYKFTAASNAETGYAGYTDWRIPTLDELKSLQEAACHSPAINVRFFSGTPTSYFWSADRYDEAYDHAYIVYFDYASVNRDHKFSYHYYRLVRTAESKKGQ